jgi:hypothetical protein
MLPDFSPYLTNPKFHFTLNQYNFIVTFNGKTSKLAAFGPNSPFLQLQAIFYFKFTSI